MEKIDKGRIEGFVWSEHGDRRVEIEDRILEGVVTR